MNDVPRLRSGIRRARRRTRALHAKVLLLEDGTPSQQRLSRFRRPLHAALATLEQVELSRGAGQDHSWSAENHGIITSATCGQLPSH